MIVRTNSVPGRWMASRSDHPEDVSALPPGALVELEALRRGIAMRGRGYLFEQILVTLAVEKPIAKERYIGNGKQVPRITKRYRYYL